MIYLTLTLAAVCLLLLFICLAQFFYIRDLRGQLKEWLWDLKEIHGSPGQKLFTRKKGLLSEVTFALNDILEDNREQIAQLKKADMANRQILTNLSHDVRTPLASLIGYLEALNSGLSDNPQEYIEISYQKALALKSLIDMLFEWCKIVSDEWRCQLAAQDINELTRECVIDWIPLLEKQNIQLRADIPETELLVSLDGTAYRRILNNLVSNAVYHGKCTNIIVKIAQEDGKAVVCVANDGLPIPKDKQPFIFERLYKCDAARTEAGSGLGLAIVKELMDAMGGNVRVVSSAQETAFFVTFMQE